MRLIDSADRVSDNGDEMDSYIEKQLDTGSLADKGKAAEAKPEKAPETEGSQGKGEAEPQLAMKETKLD